MSVLRMLSPSRASTSSASSSRCDRGIQVNIRVPSYGSVFMSFPSPIENIPRTDKELWGDLEIELPAGMGRRRVKAVRIGVRTTCNLDMGRGKKEDVIYEGKVEVRGGTSDGVILEEGLRRFAFNIIIPGNLAPHDYHLGHRVDNILFAEVQGIEESSGITTWIQRASDSWHHHSRDASPSSSPRSSSPSSNIMIPSQSLSILRQEPTIPQPPTYDSAVEDQEEIPWLAGTYTAKRTLILIYNPDPAGGVSSLDVRIDTGAPSIGPVSLQFLSDAWSVAAGLKALITIPAPSPRVAIFFIQLSLIQIANITSPRDGAKAKVERSFPLFSYGTCPRNVTDNQRLDKIDTIWRGTEAGGKDAHELALDGRGKLPIDYEGRPSTLEGVETPIKVCHTLRTEIYFSVAGEDVLGRPLPKGGPGDLRLMKVDKNTTVPACFLIPEVLNLPIYEADDVCPIWRAAGKPCPLCKATSSEQFCRTCPPTGVPHPRHDHPVKLVGNPNGVCPLCSPRVMPTGSGEWRDCACGLSREEMIARMKRITLCDREEQEEVEERRGRKGREEKEEAERVRT